MKYKIDEIIVVEGRDDITAVKQAVDAEVIAVNGFSSFSKKNIEKLKNIAKKKDIIVLTDPDYAGKKIRYLISQNIPNAKHAFISKEKCLKKNNIGIENASVASIMEALKKFNIKLLDSSDSKAEFSTEDLINNKLAGFNDSKHRRLMLGDILQIGYYNSKQLLKMLNKFGITREQFDNAVNEIDKQ